MNSLIREYNARLEALATSGNPEWKPVQLHSKQWSTIMPWSFEDAGNRCERCPLVDPHGKKADTSDLRQECQQLRHLGQALTSCNRPKQAKLKEKDSISEDTKETKRIRSSSQQFPSILYQYTLISTANSRSFVATSSLYDITDDDGKDPQQKDEAARLAKEKHETDLQSTKDWELSELKRWSAIWDPVAGNMLGEEAESSLRMKEGKKRLASIECPSGSELESVKKVNTTLGRCLLMKIRPSLWTSRMISIYKCGFSNPKREKLRLG